MKLLRIAPIYIVLLLLVGCGHKLPDFVAADQQNSANATPTPTPSPTPVVVAPTAKLGANPAPPAIVNAPANLSTMNQKQQVAYAEEQVFSVLPTGAAQMTALCARGGSDKVRTVFCGATPPTITGLRDLQTALGLDFKNLTKGNATGGNPGFVLSGHSTSLVSRITSSINPRSLVFTPALAGRGKLAPNPNLVIMGFVRGEEFVEIITQDPVKKVPAFFLVKFKHACDLTQTCTFGDLLTPALESNWVGYTIYEDIDLKNTVVDCQRCHQPTGPAGPKILRMQERQNPWTHFMRNNTPGGQALLADNLAAKGTEDSLIPGALVSSSDPANLEAVVENEGFSTQPNEFLTKTIEAEVVKISPNQPVDNSVPGSSSATWLGLYANFVAGLLAVPTPYHDVKVTDPTKLAAMTKSYSDFRAGTITAAQLPDIRDVYLDSTASEMGFTVKPGQTGAQIITQACTMCHNSALDQTITRSRFNANLSLMSRAEKDVAIQRLQLEMYHPRKMPPQRSMTLSTTDIQAAIQELLN